ncbi:MAG: hypothetical protein ACFB15_25630 [Cyclobacteriaceae bacterium]
MQRITYTLLFSIILACSQQKSEQKFSKEITKRDDLSDTTFLSVNSTSTDTKLSIKPIVQLKKEYAPIDSIDYEFSDEEYAAELFSDNMIQDLINRGIDYEFEVVENAHVENLMDTIFTFSFSNSHITIYKAGTKEIVCTALFRDNLVKVSRVEIGMSKADFGKALKISDSTIANNDVFRVVDMMWAQYMDFDFRSGQLEQMRFKGYID